MKVISEGPTRITRITINAAEKRRCRATRIVIQDATCRGLALVMNPTGLSWRFDYRLRGISPSTGRRWPMQSHFVGTPDSHGPEAAQSAASSLKGQSKAGADLAEQRRKRIDDASRRRASTISRLLPGDLAALPLRPKLRGTGGLSAASVKNKAYHLRLGLDAMAVDDRAIESVTVADLRRLLNHRAGQPATSRKHYGAVSRFFDWAWKRACSPSIRLRCYQRADVRGQSQPEPSALQWNTWRPAGERRRIWMMSSVISFTC